MIRIAEAFSEIAKTYDMELCTCSESIDLSQYGISHAHCIDKELFECLIECNFTMMFDIFYKQRGIQRIKASTPLCLKPTGR